RHRIAGREAAAGRDRRLRDRLGALHQPHGAAPEVASARGARNTSKTKSGQTSWHAWQPVQPGASSGYRYPRWFTVVLIVSTRGGQASMHSSQPLQIQNAHLT